MSEHYIVIDRPTAKFINEIDLMKSTSSVNSVSIPTHKVVETGRAIGLDYMGTVKMTKNDAKTERRLKKSDINKNVMSPDQTGSDLNQMVTPVLKKNRSIQSPQREKKQLSNQPSKLQPIKSATVSHSTNNQKTNLNKSKGANMQK